MPSKRTAPLRRILKYSPEGGPYRETNDFEWLFGDIERKFFLETYIEEFRANLKRIRKKCGSGLIIYPSVEFYFSAGNPDPDTKFHSKLILETRPNDRPSGRLNSVTIKRHDLIIPCCSMPGGYIVNRISATVDFYVRSDQHFDLPSIAKGIVFEPFIESLFKQFAGRATQTLARAYLLAQPDTFSLMDATNSFSKQYGVDTSWMVVQALDDLCVQRRITSASYGVKAFRVTNKS